MMMFSKPTSTGKIQGFVATVKNCMYVFSFTAHSIYITLFSKLNGQVMNEVSKKCS